MEKPDKILKLPLDRLDGLLRKRDLTADDIRELLRLGPLRFVIANVGSPLRWIAESETFTFWKNDASLRIVGASGVIQLEDFKDNFAYSASEWSGSPMPVVLLEMHH